MTMRDFEVERDTSSPIDMLGVNAVSSVGFAAFLLESLPANQPRTVLHPARPTTANATSAIRAAWRPGEEAERTEFIGTYLTVSAAGRARRRPGCT